MASILRGYEYDIFISYRHNDNRSGWVTEFVEALQEELAATIKEPVSVYFDSNPHDGLLETHNVDRSLEGKLKCLIFIPILSQTYCDPKSFAWQREFVAFNRMAIEGETVTLSSGEGQEVRSFGRDIKLSNGNVASRILPIKIHDLDAEDKAIIQNETGGVLRAIDFIYKEAGVNRSLLSSDSLDKNLNKTIYRNQVNKVANAIKEIISGLKSPAAERLPTTSPTERAGNNQRLTNSSKSKAKFTLVGAAILLLIIAGYFIYPKFISTSNPTDPIDRSIAVLAFENMSSDKEQEYFSDGISEEIINLLAKVKGLKVAGRTSSFYYKGKTENLRDIGNALGVHYVLEGSIRKDGENIRITAQLIKSDDGFHVWSETYDRKLTGIFEIQDEISKSIVEILKLTFKERPGTAIDPEAYDLYLQGKYVRNNISVGYDSALRTSLIYFKQAIAKSPDFADAHAMLAEVYGLAGFFNTRLDAENNWEQSKKSALKALSLDDQNCIALGALAYCKRNDWDWEESKKLYEKALAIDSNNSQILASYGGLLCALNRPEGFAFSLKALRIDPLFMERKVTLVKAALYVDKPDYAIQFIHDNNFAISDLTNSNQFLFEALVMKGDYKKAVRLYLDSIETNCSSALKRDLLETIESSGWKGFCEKAYRERSNLPMVQFSLKAPAEIWINGAPLETLFVTLEQSANKKEGFMVYVLCNPAYDPIRSDPRFGKLLRKMGLDKYQ